MAHAFPCKRSLLAMASGAALALMASEGAQAQAAATSAPTASLGLVEVSGQSRTQQLQNVPIAIQVLSSDNLKQLGASNLGQINNLVPGLDVDASQPTQPGYSLRGLGTGDFGIGTDTPVGIYVNGVYTGKTGGALMNFNDVKRIEVLAGPQGTLFGRNAAAGAISIIQNDPSGVAEASGLLRLGNQGTRHVEVLGNLPLNDSMALRVSAVSQHRDGWVTNTFDGSKAGGDHAQGLRTSLRWSDEGTSANLSWEHEKLNQKARPVWALNSRPEDLYVPSKWLDPRKQPLANDANPNVESRDFDGMTLRVEHTLPFAEFTSTTAYRHFNARNIQDNDGTANIATYLSTANIESNTTWQQEFKLSGHNSLVNWVAGASAYFEKANQDSQLNTNTNSLDTPLSAAFGQITGGGPLPPFATLTGASQQLGQALGIASLASTNLLNGQAWREDMFNQGKYRSFAVYGDAIWRLGADDNLTTGLRYTHDQKTFSWYSPLRQAGVLDQQLGGLAQTYSTLAANPNLPPEVSGQLPSLLMLTQVLTGQTPYFTNIEFNNAQAMAGQVQSKGSWNNVSPRLVYDHHLTPDQMLFASWTKGYQAGGFGWSQPLGRYEPETVTSVEFGAKGQFKEVGLYYSATVFHYTFTNLQSLVFVPPAPGQIASSYDTTTSDQKATGLDLGLQWRLSRMWRVNAALEYIDQTYGKYSKDETDPLTGSTVSVNLNGAPVGTPKLSASLGIDANWKLAEGQASANLQVGYKSAGRCNASSPYSFSCLSTPTLRIGEAQTRVNMRVGWEAPSKKWGMGLIVNNVANKQFLRSPGTDAAQLGVIYSSYSDPRAVMFEVSARL
jgi:iron complex outermembrane recepter protein